MGPKTAAESQGKKKRMLSMETKLEIVTKYEGGMRLIDLARAYDRNSSTIGTIVKQKEAIKAAKPSKGVTILSSKRSQVHDEMERLLLLWIKDKEIAGDTITESIICHKATDIFNNLVGDGGEGTSQSVPLEFKASHGWFDNFKKRSGIHSVVRHGEAASSDHKAAEEFINFFEDLVAKEGYTLQQVFNVDETGLFWKKMPRRTYITEEEKRMPGHKPMKDRLTLALCSNASGDCKVKPLLVYHSETPRAFKKHKILKEKLPVLWRANAKAWVTRLFFVQWVNLCFGPAVKTYLKKNKLPMKCLLVLDNAPAHPPGLEEDILVEYSFIKVLYLPPNTTPLIQPMDQQVISNFKKLYTKHLFKRCFEITDSTKLTLREFWKQHFDIGICVRLIDTAWQEVSRRTLNSAWRKLWPDAFAGFEAGEDIAATEDDSETVDDPEPVEEGGSVVEEIVSLGRAMGLVVDEGDINELLHEHQEELTTDDLKELEAMQHSVLQEEFSGSEEEGETDTSTLSTAEIKKMLSAYQTMADLVEKFHPEKLQTGRVLTQCNDICLTYFRNIIKSRQKQASLDDYFKKRPLAPMEEEQEDGKSEKKRKAKKKKKSQ